MFSNDTASFRLRNKNGDVQSPGQDTGGNPLETSLKGVGKTGLAYPCQLGSPQSPADYETRYTCVLLVASGVFVGRNSYSRPTKECINVIQHEELFKW